MGTYLGSRCGGNELALTAASLGVGLPGKRISIGYFRPILLVESRSKATRFLSFLFSLPAQRCLSGTGIPGVKRIPDSLIIMVVVVAASI